MFLVFEESFLQEKNRVQSSTDLAVRYARLKPVATIRIPPESRDQILQLLRHIRIKRLPDLLRGGTLGGPKAAAVGALLEKGAKKASEEGGRMSGEDIKSLVDKMGFAKADVMQAHHLYASKQKVCAFHAEII